MDKKISKLDCLIKKYLNKSKEEIYQVFGKPQCNSDGEVWFYNRYKYGIFRDEIAFIFEENRVIDIVLTGYIFWKEMYAVYYFEGETPKYKAVKMD